MLLLRKFLFVKNGYRLKTHARTGSQLGPTYPTFTFILRSEYRKCPDFLVSVYHIHLNIHSELNFIEPVHSCQCISTFKGKSRLSIRTI